MTINANFAEFRAHVMQRVLDPALFAEVVTWKIPERADITPTVLVDYRDEIVNDGHGETVVETIKVTCKMGDIPDPPARGHKIRRAGEDRDYLFMYGGRHDVDAYRVVFERRRRITERGK